MTPVCWVEDTYITHIYQVEVREVRAGGEKRGNSLDRKRRKFWMLQHFGNGTTCKCAHCKSKLTYETVTADRIEPGGTYARGNIQPACIDCNRKRGNREVRMFPRLVAA